MLSSEEALERGVPKCPREIATAIRKGTHVTVDLLRLAESDVNSIEWQVLIENVAEQDNKVVVNVYGQDDPRNKSPLYRYLILKRLVELFDRAKYSPCDITYGGDDCAFLGLLRDEIFCMSIAEDNQSVLASTAEEKQYIDQFIHSTVLCTADVTIGAAKEFVRRAGDIQVKAWMLTRYIALSMISMRLPVESTPRADSMYSTVYDALRAGHDANYILDQIFPSVNAEKVILLSNDDSRIMDLVSLSRADVLQIDDSTFNRLRKADLAQRLFWDARACIWEALQTRKIPDSEVLPPKISKCFRAIKELDQNDASTFLWNVLQYELTASLSSGITSLFKDQKIDDLSTIRKRLIDLALTYAPARDYVKKIYGC
jgi:hypothetical protein